MAKSLADLKYGGIPKTPAFGMSYHGALYPNAYWVPFIRAIRARLDWPRPGTVDVLGSALSSLLPDRAASFLSQVQPNLPDN